MTNISYCNDCSTAVFWTGEGEAPQRCNLCLAKLPDFSGPVYEREYDLERLTTQKEKVFEVMKCGNWRTLGRISHLTGAPEASASAMLRAFRQTRHGGHTVNRRRRGNPRQGLFEYQLILKPRPPEQLPLI